MPTNTDRPYQLLDPLPPEQMQALEADIAKRGVQVAVEIDENGQILDDDPEQAAFKKKRTGRPRGRKSRPSIDRFCHCPECRRTNTQ